jgi:hypothetical protein
MLVREFLDEIFQRDERDFNRRAHEAFLAWYIEAEFGQADWKFTDNVNDGGIDAVVWRPHEVPPVVIIQSKFTEHLGRAPLSHGAYHEFRNVVGAFWQGDEAFAKFLSCVRDDVKTVYRKAFDRLSELGNWLNEKKAFRLVTTCSRRPQGEFDKIPRSNFVYAEAIVHLYKQYRKGATPKPRPLELRIEDKLSYKDPMRGVTSYLFNARIADMRKYLEDHDVSRLVARNIRYNLGGKVSRDIRRTNEKLPLDFWYLHNGLTLICDEFSEKDQTATLMNPSVVNGAQTLYAISGSSRKNSGALVTARVIVRGRNHDEAVEDDEWLQRVIRGVNTQNRVRAYDFRSNEPEQIELQKKFREMKVFYERKRGEWREYRNEPRYRGFDRLSLRTLGMILTAISEKDGHGVLLVKRGVENIFDERNYRKLFPSRSKVSRRFQKVYLAYRTYRLLNRCRSGVEFRKQRHGFWNTLWLLHLGLESGDRRTNLSAVREAFDKFEDNGAAGRRTRRIVREVRKAVWLAWRMARRANPERWTPANFFKSKYGKPKAHHAGLSKGTPWATLAGWVSSGPSKGSLACRGVPPFQAVERPVARAEA